MEPMSHINDLHKSWSGHIINFKSNAHGQHYDSSYFIVPSSGQTEVHWRKQKQSVPFPFPKWNPKAPDYHQQHLNIRTQCW